MSTKAKLICKFCNKGELATRQQLMCKECFRKRDNDINENDTKRVGTTSRFRASLKSKE